MPEVLTWPPDSSDFNSTEHFWDVLPNLWSFHLTTYWTYRKVSTASILVLRVTCRWHETVWAF